MKEELKNVLGMVANVLKSFAEEMGTFAGKVDALAQTQGHTEMKPNEPKPKTTKPNKAERIKKPVTREKKPVKKTVVKAPVKKAALKAAPENKPVTQPAVRNPVKKETVVKPAPENKEAGTASDAVLKIISDATDGIGPKGIMEKTRFDQRKVSNIIHRLKQQGKIESPKRGMYSKKG